MFSRELRGADPPGGLHPGQDAVRGADRSGLPAGLLRLQRLELSELRHRGSGRTPTVSISLLLVVEPFRLRLQSNKQSLKEQSDILAQHEG